MILKSRERWQRDSSSQKHPRLMGVRSRLLSAGKVGKGLLGGAFLVIGFAIVSGADKWIETVLVDASPQWLTQLTTSF